MRRASIVYSYMQLDAMTALTAERGYAWAYRPHMYGVGVRSLPAP